MSTAAGVVAPASANAVLARFDEDRGRNVDFGASCDFLPPMLGEFVPTPLADAADAPFQGGGFGLGGGRER